MFRFSKEKSKNENEIYPSIDRLQNGQTTRKPKKGRKYGLRKKNKEILCKIRDRRTRKRVKQTKINEYG